MHKCRENVIKIAQLMGSIRTAVICLIILHQVELKTLFCFIVTILFNFDFKLFFDKSEIF